MDNKLVAAGIAGVVGLLLGMAVAPGGSDTEELSNALSGRFEQLSAEVQEVEDVAQEVRGGIVTLDERLVALEAANAANGLTLATVVEELTAQIDDHMAALEQTFGTRAQESRAATAAAMEILLAAVAAGASPPSQEQSAAGQGEPMAAAPAQSAPVQEMNRDIVAGMLYPTGRTMLAGEGIVRAYVSRVD